MTTVDDYTDLPEDPAVHGVRFLPGRNTIKEDLQAIFETQKGIGATLWSLQRLVSTIRCGAAQHTDECVKTADALTELLDKLKHNVDSLTSHIVSLDNTNEERFDDIEKLLTESMAHEKLIGKDWDKVLFAVDALLKANGIDPRTLAQRDTQRDAEIALEFKNMEKRRERWVNAFISGFVGILFSIMMGLYAKYALNDQQNNNSQLLKEVQVLAESVKKQGSALDTHLDPKTK